MSWVNSVCETLKHQANLRLNGSESRMYTMKSMKHTLDMMIRIEGGADAEEVVVNGMVVSDTE